MTRLPAWTAAILAAAAVQASALTERDVVLGYLSRSTDIQLVRNSRQADSLGLELTRAGWLPSVTARASGEVSTGGDEVFPNGDDRGRTLAGSLSGAQTLPGGGAITGSVSQGISRDLRSSYADSVRDSLESSVSSTAFSVGYTQPLLKHAWRFGAQDYAMTVRRIDRRVYTLTEKKDLLSKISAARMAYWDLYAANVGVRIWQAEVEYYQQRLAMQRQRLAVGTATVLDTLSASLELLKKRQSLLDAEINLTAARRGLSLLLDVDPDSLSVDSALTIAVGEIPPPDEFIARVQQFDPQIRIFEALNEKLRLEIARQRNLRLPAVDVSAAYNGSVSALQYGAADPVKASSGVISLIASYAIPTRSLRLSGKLAQLAYEKNNMSREKYLRDLPQNLEALRQQWDLDKQRIALGVMTEEVARRNVEVAEKRFEVGTIDNLTLLNARNDYTKAAIGLVSNQIELKKVEIDIQELLGTSLSEFGVTWE